MMSYEWEAELYARWPYHLRVAAFDNQYLLKQNEGGDSGKFSNFLASMRAAVWAAQQPSFNPRTEKVNRYEEFLAEYRRTLAVKAGRLPPRSDAFVQASKDFRKQQAARNTEMLFDPANFKIRGPGIETLERHLTNNNLTYTRFSSPHPCTLCDDGPVNEIVLSELLTQRAALNKDKLPVPADISQQITLLRLKVQNYRLHKQQLASNRAYVNAKLATLIPKEVGVTRDFVNHYDSRGQHVKCLIFVLQWREIPGAPLKLLKIRNYCSHAETLSCDSYYNADCTDFHLRAKSDFTPGHFDTFTKVYFFGDHGPHFASVATMFNESTFYRIYSKEVYDNFFTSYHAYGRADGAGSEDNMSFANDFRKGVPRLGARSWAEMTNASNDPLSIAYAFDKINRDVNTFPPAKELQPPKHLRKWTETKYEYIGRTQETEGVVCYRLISFFVVKASGNMATCAKVDGLRTSPPCAPHAPLKLKQQCSTLLSCVLTLSTWRCCQRRSCWDQTKDVFKVSKC